MLNNKGVLKMKINEQTLESIQNDLKRNHPQLLLDAFTDFEAREALKEVLDKEHGVLLRTEENLEDVIQEIVGLGIIETIIKQDESVTDITYNGTDLIVKSNNNKYVYDEKEITENYIIKLIQKFANAVGKEFTPKNGILDATLGNFRLNAVHRTRSPYGTTMALRTSRPKLALNEDNFSDFAPTYMLDFFKAVIKTRSNIVISGETGTGKTEFQKLLVSEIPFKEKICLIEDTLDSHIKTLFPEKDIHSWVTSASTSMTDLIKAALRNNPVWLLVSETRGKEAYEMLQAILSGHSIITTLHAKNARAIPRRFVNMMKMGYQVDEKSIESDIYNYFGFGAHLEQTEINGKTKRYLSEVVEYLEDGTVLTVFKQVKEGDLIYPVTGSYSEDFEMLMKKFNCNFKGFEKEKVYV